MQWLDRLRRRLEPYAVPHLTLALVAGQVGVFVLSLGDPQILFRMVLVPQLVMQGEFWRLVTFLFAPPVAHPIFLFFYWYLFALMGTALESQWGNLRYNLFLLIGYLATTGVSFITPDVPSSNAFLQSSVFLAFAFLFPDFVLHLFLIFPVKIKWLAAIAWLSYLYLLVTGGTLARLLVIASVGNFFLFFGPDLWYRLRQGHRRMRWQARSTTRKDVARHRCRVCGITNISHPKMQFRYCSQCAGQCGYCTEHINDHEHVPEDCEARNPR